MVPYFGSSLFLSSDPDKVTKQSDELNFGLDVSFTYICQ